MAPVPMQIMEQKGSGTGSEGLYDRIVRLDALDPALPRILAGLVNSGGGLLILRPPESGIADTRSALKRAAAEIVPSPTVDGAPEDAGGTTIVVPPLIRTEKIDLDGAPHLLVHAGECTAFCTVGGTAYILEDGAVRPLTLVEVVRRSGAGG